MKKAVSLIALGLPLVLMGQDSCSEPDDLVWAPPGPDFAAPGLEEVTATPGSIEAPSGCTLDYTRYAPASGARGDLVILTHGFQRGQRHMAELATHLASWGMIVLTPDLCHSTPLDSDIEGDVADMIALVDAQSRARVIYMGHSAGGMRSMLAGAQDGRAQAVIGLDAVDALDLALEAAPSLSIPLLGIVGEPSACNAGSNGIPVYEAAPGAIALRVSESDHCDYEGPTDALCTSVCSGTNAQFSDETLRQAVFGLATAAAQWQAGADAQGGADWWQAGGETYSWLVDAGLAIPLVP